MRTVNTYQSAHRRLRRIRGSASNFTCLCGEPATQWAYQFTAGDRELNSPDGSHPYSTDPDDYKPMCRKCHRAFDVEHDPAMAEAIQESGRRNAATRVKRLRTDPEFAERMREVLRKNARKRRRCLECGLTCNPAGMSSHQRSTGHSGYRDEASL